MFNPDTAPVGAAGLRVIEAAATSFAVKVSAAFVHDASGIEATITALARSGGRVGCGRGVHLDVVRRPPAGAETGASLRLVTRSALHRRHFLDRPPGGCQKRMNVLQVLNPPVR
jgi:hypothetical protein